jgi:hypothetical protein
VHVGTRKRGKWLVNKVHDMTIAKLDITPIPFLSWAHGIMLWQTATMKKLTDDA